MIMAEIRCWQGLQVILSVNLTVKTLKALINKDSNLSKLIFCIIGTEEPKLLSVRNSRFGTVTPKAVVALLVPESED